MPTARGRPPAGSWTGLDHALGEEATLGPWLPFPPQDFSRIPDAPGVYALADQKVQILTIAAALSLREALQDLAAVPPLPLRDLATHFWMEQHARPNRRRRELVNRLRASTGAFPPCNRRHPRFSVRLPAWTRHPAGRPGREPAPAHTVNVSHAGLMLALPEAPSAGTTLGLGVETPFGLVQGEGRLAWTESRPRGIWAGVILQRLETALDALRWERLIASLAERVIHA